MNRRRSNSAGGLRSHIGTHGLPRYLKESRLPRLPCLIGRIQKWRRTCAPTPTELSLFAPRMDRMSLAKLTDWALRLDISLPQPGLRQAARSVMEDGIRAMQEVRKNKREPVTLKVEGEVTALIQQLAEELPVDAGLVSSPGDHQRLDAQRLAFEKQIDEAQATLRRLGQEVTAEELRRSVEDWGELQRALKVAVPSHRDVVSEQLACQKLRADFYGGCLRHSADQRQAERQLHEVKRVISEEKNLKVPGLFPNDEKIILPRRHGLGSLPTSPSVPDSEMLAAVAPLIEHCRRNPVAVNCGAYKPGCFAVFTSLQNRYGLQVSLLYNDVIGRDQIAHLSHDEDVDFLIAPLGPFLMLGDSRACDYCPITPIYSFEQALLRKRGKPRTGRREPW